MSKKIEEAVEKLAEPIASENGLLIYDVELKKEGPDLVLRVFIDKEDGFISIEDCENVSRPLKEALDSTDFDYSYLEVSSPGIERQLKKPADFQRFAGERVLVSLFSALEGKKKLEGILKDRNDECLVISENDVEIKIANDKIASVRLVADF